MAEKKPEGKDDKKVAGMINDLGKNVAGMEKSLATIGKLQEQAAKNPADAGKVMKQLSEAISSMSKMLDATEKANKEVLSNIK